MTNSAIEKYLQKYAEKEALDLCLPKIYEHILIIPAHRETSSSLKAVWQKIPMEISLLVIIVINSSKTDDEHEITLFSELTNGGQKTELKPGISLITLTKEPDLLIIDRFSKGNTISSRYGVGLARKIGCDVALRLHHKNCLNSPFFRNTDADAILPANYFESQVSNAVGFVYPFRHISASFENGQHDQQRARADLAASLYDLSLLHYPAGLLQAGSPYAFPTIGSTICCTAEAYSHVRGFPRRNTGEDFYLLNKLRKLGPVRAIENSPIELSSRHSTRVPIGTGQSIAKIADLGNPIEEFQFEHPECFIKLRKFLKQMQLIALTGDADLLNEDQTINGYLKTSGLQALIEKKLREHPRKEVRLKFIMDWFDALRTRQFINLVRDEQCGTVSVTQLAQHFSISGSPENAIAKLRHHFNNQIYH